MEAMTVSADEPARSSSTARKAIGLATFVVIVVVVSATIFFVALATGGDDAVSDTWVGAQAAWALLVGLLVSLVALVLAVVVKVRRERARLLWLPLTVFPALVALLVLAELVVME